MALQIDSFVLELVRKMRPVLEAIAKHDRDLAGQGKRALASIALNSREGSYQRGGHGRMRFQSAMGSADEVKGVLLFAEAFGYVEDVGDLVDGFDRVARTFCKLRK